MNLVLLHRNQDSPAPNPREIDLEKNPVPTPQNNTSPFPRGMIEKGF